MKTQGVSLRCPSLAPQGGITGLLWRNILPLLAIFLHHIFASKHCFQTMWFENISPMLLTVWVLGKASLVWVYQLYCSNCSRKPGLLLAEFSVMRLLPWCGDHLCLTRKSPVECPCRVREELLSLSTDMLGAGSHLCSYPVEMTNNF